LTIPEPNIIEYNQVDGVNWEPSVWAAFQGVTRQQLGSSYLVGTTVVLLGGQLAHLVFTVESELTLYVGAFAAGLPLLAVAYVGATSWRRKALVDAAWEVALWYSLGLGLATVFTVVIALPQAWLVQPGSLPLVAVVSLPGGAVTGVLLGVVTQFRHRSEELRDLDQRNAVQNRVLRHNIRNEMSVILAHAEMLDADGSAGAVKPHAETIRRKTQEVLAISDAARSVNELAAADDTGQVDVAELVGERVAETSADFPTAAVDYEGPETAMAQVDPILGSVIDNLLENAIVHHDGEATVTISLAVHGAGGELELEVTDDGPGIPPEQVAVLREGTEETDRHGSGLGLWLTKWYADTHEGELTIETTEGRGTTVTLRLPVAPPAED